MSNRGFTLIELLGTIVILSIVAGIAIAAVNVNLDKTKEKSEEVFVDTLKDAVDMYLSKSFGDLKNNGKCNNNLLKKYGEVSVYKFVKDNGSMLTFNDIINSSYHPITDGEFVNPALEGDDRKCNKSAQINVYRDDDFVYYYSIDKSGLGCLKNIGGEYDSVISILPEGYVCG